MFKFKMLTKVMVAVLVVGQLIELNVRPCIALSIESRISTSPQTTTSLVGQSQHSTSNDNSLVNQQNLDNPNATNQPESDSLAGRTTTVTTSETNIYNELQDSSEDDDSTKTSGAIQITESTGKLNYFGEIWVGNPAKSFMVHFDTSSTAFWLPSSECKSFRCIGRIVYAANESTSHEPDGRKLQLNYGIGIQVEAKLSRDSLRFAGLTIDNQTFAEATKVDGDALGKMPVDGIFGLGFGRGTVARRAATARTCRKFSISTDCQLLNDELGGQPENQANNFTASGRQLSLVESLYARGLIAAPLFTLYLNGYGHPLIYTPYSGELTLGEINPDQYTGELTYVPVHPRSDYWQFTLSSVFVRNAMGIAERGCQAQCLAILDTSVRIIGGHKADIERINRALGAQERENGIWVLSECNPHALPDLVFMIGDTEFVVPPEEYAIKITVGSQVVACHSALTEIDSEKYPFWVLGEYFMRKRFVLFDYANARIGLANARQIVKHEMFDMGVPKPRLKTHINW